MLKIVEARFDGMLAQFITFDNINVVIFEINKHDSAGQG